MQKDNVVYQRNNIDLDGKSFVDTGIKLFNAENIKKDFEVVFTFPETIPLNINQSTIISAIDESDETFPGFCVRYYVDSKEGDKIQITYGGQKGRLIPITDCVGKTLKVFRKNEEIYTSLNDETPVKLTNNPTKQFETTIVFGCAVLYDENGVAQVFDDKNTKKPRFYKGDIYDVVIKIFDENVIVSKATKKIYSKSSMETGSEKINKKYINTGIKLFDEENWGKDFEVSFNIDNVGSNADKATLFNALYESKSALWPGILVRYVKNTNKLHLEASYLDENGKNVTAPKEWNINDVSQITIYRENNILYYSVNNSLEKEQLVSNENIPKHDVPVIFGSSVQENGTTYDRNFNGILSNMLIKLEGKTVFEYKEEKEFTGEIVTETECDITDIKLFDEENIYKDFTISFNIDDIGTNSERATIIGSNIEVAPWYGFCFRIQSGKLRLEANNGETKANTWDIDKVSKITISRINNKLYYQTNNENKLKELLEYSVDEKHDVPVTIGCYLDPNGKPERYFNGKLSNVEIYIEP